MTVSTIASVKSFFEAGKRPTEQNFVDLIDSTYNPEIVVALASAAGASTGVLRVTSASAVALVNASAGNAVLDAETQASARSALGSTTVGDAVFIATDAAAGRTALELVKGTATGNVVALEDVDGTPGLPAVDGSQLTGLDPGPTLGTAVATTSGTEAAFTGIPAGVSRISVNLVGVKTDDVGNLVIQIGDSGGVEASGYLGAGSAVTNSSTTVTNATSAFLILAGVSTAVIHGSVILELENASTNTWVAHGNLARSDLTVALSVAGSKSLSGALTQLQVKPTVGNFAAGAINIAYE